MKIALSNLIADRQNPRRVKPELVSELAGLFEKAATKLEGIGEPGLAERVNGWMPSVESEPV
ncbi:MAG: hypothetical protein KF691_03380 [Phycisphaeraceae bacterium]|nr:hypothetical protein [Phycisphaeraceae bacterium]